MKLSKHLTEQAIAICEKAELHDECRPNRKEHFKIAFILNGTFSDSLCTDIVCCCVGAAHTAAYFKLLPEALSMTNKEITAIAIHRHRVLDEGEEV